MIASFTHFEIGTPGSSSTGSGGDVGPAVVRWLDVYKRFMVGKRMFNHLVESSHLANTDVSIRSRSKAG
jgi:hypothetical protein